MATVGKRRRGRKDGESIARAGKHRARGRLGSRGERSAGEIREQREERPQGRTCSPARTRSPTPPVEAAAAEAPPPPPLFPIRARSSRRRAAVSRRLFWSSIEQDTSRFASPFPLPHPREEQLPADCCFPTASSGEHRAGAGPEPPPPVFPRAGAGPEPPPPVFPRAGAGPEPPPPVFPQARYSAPALYFSSVFCLLSSRTAAC